jgi:hypothetical protein
MCIKKHQWTSLPKSLKILIVPSHFAASGKRILWLKDLVNLEHLEFKCYRYHSVFNDIIKNLPPGVKILRELGVLDPNPSNIQDQFPDSLEQIIGNFNYKGTLPKNIKVFDCPTYEINSALPMSLQYLRVKSVKGEGLKALSQLPNLKTFICYEYNPSGEKNTGFPSSLEHLEIRSSANNITSFPSSLKTLIIPITSLPNGIRLPEKLETLRLSKSGVNLDVYLPSELNKITFKPY